MKVFLDLDGVLVDFRRGVCEAFGRDDPSDDWTFWKDWEGVTTEDVNERCDSAFWMNLKWTTEGPEILQAVCQKFGLENIYLTTAPMPNPDSGTGKLLWIKRHLRFLYNNTIISYAPKSLLAGPDTLLIDDKDENIAEFTAAGGRGILVPRRWNELCELSHITLDYVKRCLEEF